MFGIICTMFRNPPEHSPNTPHPRIPRNFGIVFFFIEMSDVIARRLFLLIFYYNPAIPRNSAKFRKDGTILYLNGSVIPLF